MSQENVETVRRTFAAWNSGDFDALAADSTPDVEWDLSHVEDWPEQTAYRGVDQLRLLWDQWRGTWNEFHTEALQLQASGDKVFCRHLTTGTGKASGASVELEMGQVTILRDGKVARNVLYSDPGEAALAAGTRR